MLGHIIRKSLSKRKARIAVAIISIIIGTSIASALLTVSFDVRDKIGLEFRQYGANIMVMAKRDTVSISIGDVDYGFMTDQRFIEESDLPRINEIYWAKNILGYAPYLYSIASIEGQGVVVAGTWFDQVEKISPWWDVQGEWITDRNDSTGAMIGSEVSEILGLAIGDSLTLTLNVSGNEVSKTLDVIGIINTGKSEDSQIFITLSLAQELTEKDNKVSTVQVSALCIECPAEVIAAEIEAAIPYVEAKSVRQIVDSEMAILEKIENLMVLLVVVSLLASTVGVMTTMTMSVIERTKEIGMMKALGAENSKIASLFLLEALVVGLIGGIIGYLIGIGIANFIGMMVFNSSISANLIVIPLAIGISVAVAILASGLPVRRAVAIEPAKVLRGE